MSVYSNHPHMGLFFSLYQYTPTISCACLSEKDGMKADYERQTSDISAVLTQVNAEPAELANSADNEHPVLAAFMK